jgi:DNA-binding NarL/FixJ family response regulator
MPADIIRVILADDHAVVRKGIREFFTEPSDIDVIAEASDGDEAIHLIDQLRPDVAVLDIEMPKRSGIDVCRHVRAQRWPIGILILTAYDDAPMCWPCCRRAPTATSSRQRTPMISFRPCVTYEGKSVLDPSIARKLMTQLAGPSDKPIESLTPRETDVLQLAARGFTNKAIGAQLNVSDRTVQGHLANIFGKLHVATRTEAVMRAVALGWLSPTDTIE